MKIAIVGGIGSGKSEVLKVARELGLATLSADEINAELLQNPDYIQKIEQYFPSAVVNGAIDRKVLGNEVFADESKRKLLNSIAHPEILKRFQTLDAKNAVIEVPLILESGAQNLFDEIVLVSAPVELRIKRLLGRGLSRERAQAVIAAQVSEDELKRIATRTLDNSGGIERLKTQAEMLFRELCK